MITQMLCTVKAGLSDKLYTTVNTPGHYTTYLQMVPGLLAGITPCVLTQCTNQKTLDFLNNNKPV